MKLIISLLFVAILASCNNPKTGTPTTDSPVKVTAADTLHGPVADSAREEYCYITGVEKQHDSIFIQADYVQYYNGPNVVEEAKKLHRADTAFDKAGKIQDIFVPDDYFIVNEDKQLRKLYLMPACVISMDSEIAGEKTKDINNYAYFSQHFQNSLFKIALKNNNVTAVREVFLP